ncbi:nuclear transport factor 2 family protein [Micromonospora mirobrigensis]|uniref:SnoaL-like domain-containing protein n=1 Tax=Micromonospora mirobrigensis TaxID=262898 RepID=A0A1C5A000_9ACTN|nr:nuclear transport factor 2 family protein [Micromonospora mirobrigensis]SCF38515.1 SnoaL-like domain-containing protein [Micromonospora mirobrigensis]
MPTVTELVHRYVALWNEADPDVRRREIPAIWSERGVYTDPVVVMVGHDAIEALVGTARSQFEGHQVRLLTTVDAHHNVARFGCAVVRPGRAHRTLVTCDVAVADDDGRLRYVHVFIDALAPH